MKISSRLQTKIVGIIRDEAFEVQKAISRLHRDGLIEHDAWREIHQAICNQQYYAGEKVLHAIWLYRKKH